MDSAAFNLRLGTSLVKKGLVSKGGGPTRLLYYICPQVWASRPRRSLVLDKIVDSAATIVPLDLPYYRNLNLPLRLVEHPLLTHPSPLTYDKAGPLWVAPGSRETELALHLPVVKQVLEALQVPCVMSYPHSVAKNLMERFLNRHVSLKKRVELRHCRAPLVARAALTKIGTVTLEASLAGIPHVNFACGRALDILLVRFLKSSGYFSLENRLLNEVVCPEFVGSVHSVTSRLTDSLSQCLRDEHAPVRMRVLAMRLKSLLDGPSAETWLAEQLGLA